MSIIVETLVTLRPPAVMPVFIEVMAEKAMPLLKRHGLDPFAAWSQAGGPAQQVMHLSRFDSLASYERARASLEKESSRSTWIVEALQGVDVTEVISVGEPSPYSPDERIDRALAESGTSPRKCFQRIARMRLGMEEEAKEHLAVIIREVEKNSGAIQLITGVQSILGRRDELKDTFILPKGQDALAEARAAEAAIEGDTVDRWHACLKEEETLFLNPLPYSPIQ